MAVVQTPTGGVSTAFPERYNPLYLPPTKPSVPLPPPKEPEPEIRRRKRTNGVPPPTAEKQLPQSTMETPTPAATVPTYTTPSKENPLGLPTTNNPLVTNILPSVPQTIGNQFLTTNQKLPSGEIVSSIEVPVQRLPGVKYTDEVPIKTGQEERYYTQDGNLYKQTSEFYSGGGKTEVGYNVFGGKDQYIEYQNPLGTTSTVKVSPGQTIYYNPAGGYGATTSKIVPEGSYEVNIQGERLFGGQTAGDIYKQQYEQQGYFGKVGAVAKSELYFQNFLGLGDLYDLVSKGKLGTERVTTALTEQSYSPSGQTKLSTGQIISKSPLFKASVVTAGTFALYSGVGEVAAVTVLPVLAKYAPGTLAAGSSIISSAISPSVVGSVAPAVGTFLIPEYEYQRESKIYKATGDYGAVIGDIAYQGVELGSAILGGAVVSKVVGGDPFRISQPEFSGPMEFKQVALSGGVTPEGNVFKSSEFYGYQEAQFEGSILPPRRRVAVGFLETTELPGGNVVIRPGSYVKIGTSEYSFRQGKEVFNFREFDIGSPLPTSVSKVSSLTKGSELFKVSPGELPSIQGSKGTLYLKDIESGRVFSIKPRGISMPLPEGEGYRFVATTKSKGITARGTVIDDLGLYPTREPLVSGQPKSYFTFTKEPTGSMKPFDLSEYQKVNRPFKPSPSTTGKSSLRLPESTPSESIYYGQGQYERTEGGLLPRQLPRSDVTPVFGAVEKSFAINEQAFKTKGGLGIPVVTPATEVGTRLKRPQIFSPSDISLTKQTFQGKFTTSPVVIQTGGQTQISRQRQDQIPVQSELLKQTTTQITTTITPPPSSITFPRTTITPLPPFVPLTPGFSEPYQYKRPSRGRKRKSIYQSSLTAALLGIKAPRKPSGYFGGESPFLRPLIGGTRRRKSRKKKR